MEKAIVQHELDQEWVDLIFEAFKMGLTVEEVHSFIKENSNG